MSAFEYLGNGFSLITEKCEWLLPLLLLVPLLGACTTMIRHLVGDSFSLADVFTSIGRWFKNRFIDFLKLFIPMPKLIAWRLARPGIDYVDCSKQECSKCPFVTTCENAVLDTQGKYIK